MASHRETPADRRPAVGGIGRFRMAHGGTAAARAAGGAAGAAAGTGWATTATTTATTL